MGLSKGALAAVVLSFVIATVALGVAIRNLVQDSSDSTAGASTPVVPSATATTGPVFRPLCYDRGVTADCQYRLVMFDYFDDYTSPVPDPSKWTQVVYPDTSITNSCANYTNGSDNVFVDTVQQELVIRLSNGTPITLQDFVNSGRVQTTQTFGPTGVFVTRVNIPHGNGWVWPAVWLLSEEMAWPIEGEIDIHESFTVPDNDFDQALFTLHCGQTKGVDVQYPLNPNNRVDTPASQLYNQNITVVCVWTTTGMAVYYTDAQGSFDPVTGLVLDGTGASVPAAKQYTKSEFDWDTECTNGVSFNRPMNLIFNIAAGSGGKIFTGFPGGGPGVGCTGPNPDGCCNEEFITYMSQNTVELRVQSVEIYQSA